MPDTLPAVRPPTFPPLLRPPGGSRRGDVLLALAALTFAAARGWRDLPGVWLVQREMEGVYRVGQCTNAYLRTTLLAEKPQSRYMVMQKCGLSRQ
jgi:hypothetical protein